MALDLSICVGHCGRSPATVDGAPVPIFQRCVASLGDALDAAGVEGELVVADWPGVNGNPAVSTWIGQVFAGPWIVVQPAGPFTRGGGRNAAAAVARCDRLFFMDADMLVSADVIRAGMASLAAGRGCFPFYMRKHRDGSLHPGNGTGNGFCTREQYAAAGPFPERADWGGEDTAFARWFNARDIMDRPYIETFIHQRH